LDDGRYPLRAPGSDEAAEAVLVVQTVGAPAPPRRLRRKPKPSATDPEAERAVPLTTLTVIEPSPIEGDPAAWLAALGGDVELRGRLVDRALAQVTRLLAARRVAAADASIPDPSLDSVAAVRVGYGVGDDLVDGLYEAALEVPRDSTRRSRAATLRPQERMAALLGGRERALACEELIIRARADLDAGRSREAALQLRVGLEAMLAERDALTSTGQAEDLAFLDGRRESTGNAANEALAGELADERAAEVAETVAVCERVLRRRAVLG
jgi:hypothetical protein